MYQSLAMKTDIKMVFQKILALFTPLCTKQKN